MALWLAALLLMALAYPFYVVHRQTLGEHRPIRHTPAEWGADYETITHTASDGIVLRGWWVPGRGERAVLLLHGKGGDRNGEQTGIFELGRWYWERGYHVMMADMRGHGESGGKYTYFGVREHVDMLRWIDALDTKRRYRWALHGFSLGAATALMMQQKAPGRFTWVVADAPWIDFATLVKKELEKRAWLPPFTYPYVRWVAETFFGQSFKIADNQARCQRLCGRPVLYLFEDEDTLLTPYQRERLETLCPRAETVRFAGVGHVEAFRDDPKAYTETLKAHGL
ncbi:alpha/beta hydrolase [Hydrogenimonas sp.]